MEDGQRSLLAERFQAALHDTMHHLGPKSLSFASLDLTPPQMFMLRAIQMDDSCTITHLSDKMEVKPSAITVMLDRLEHRGYVIRERDVKDRRVVFVRLTDAGQVALNKLRAIYMGMVEACIDQFDQEEFMMLLNSLEKIANVAKQLDLEQIARQLGTPLI